MVPRVFTVGIRAWHGSLLGRSAAREGKATEPDGGQRADGFGVRSNQPNHHVLVAAVAMPSTAHSSLWPPGSNVMSNQARSLTTNSPRQATNRSAPITRCPVGRKGPRVLVFERKGGREGKRA